MEWVQIEDTKYDINREGQIRHRWKTKTTFLKPWINTDGYFRTGLTYNNSRKKKFIHRLLAIAFIDNPEQKPCVDHMDRNRSNNNLSNLRWATHSENQKNKTRKGSVFKTKYNTWCAQAMNVEGKQIQKSFKTWELANQWRIDNLVQYIIT